MATARGRPEDDEKPSPGLFANIFEGGTPLCYALASSAEGPFDSATPLDNAPSASPKGRVTVLPWPGGLELCGQ